MVFAIPGIAAAIVLVILFFWFRNSIGRDLSAPRCLGAFSLVLGLLAVTFSHVRVNERISAADVFLLIGGVLTAPALLFEGALRHYQVRIFALGALLFCFGVVSAVGSADMTENLMAALRFSVALAGVPILIAASANSAKRLKAFVSVWLAGSAFNALWGVLQFMGLPVWDSPSNSQIYGQHRVSGLTGHPNNFATACLLSFPVALVVMLRHRTIRGRFLYGLMALLLALGILVSGSRAGLLGLALAVGLVSYTELRRSPRKLLWLPVFGALAVVIMPSITSSFDDSQLLLGLHRLTGEVSVGTSDSGRLEIYDLAIDDWMRHPAFGIGLSDIDGFEAHDLYLRLLETGGVACLLVFLAVIGYASYHGWRLATDPRLESQWRGMAGALLASIVVYLAVDAVQPVFYERFVFVPIGFIFALVQVQPELLRLARYPMCLEIYQRYSGRAEA